MVCEWHSGAAFESRVSEQPGKLLRERQRVRVRPLKHAHCVYTESSRWAAHALRALADVLFGHRAALHSTHTHRMRITLCTTHLAACFSFPGPFCSSADFTFDDCIRLAWYANAYLTTGISGECRGTEGQGAFRAEGSHSRVGHMGGRRWGGWEGEYGGVQIGALGPATAVRGHAAALGHLAAS